MAMWLYQIDQKNWTPERYRLEIWENEKWVWSVGNSSKKGKEIQRGDTVVFFYAKSGGKEPGFYGWAIVLEWKEDDKYIYFYPTSPSNYLKMIPWWNEEAEKLADDIRGNTKRGTLWLIEDKLAKRVKKGIHEWTTYGRDEDE